MSLTLLDLSEAKKAVILSEAKDPLLRPQSSKTANSALPGSVSSRVLEAASPLIFYGSPGDFEGGFRRISQPTSPWRDLLPPMQWNMQRVCYYLYVTNPLAHRIVELQKDFVVGEGVKIRAKDPQVQDVIEGFWHDPVNRMDVNIEAMARDLSIFGETHWFAESNPISGKARVAYIDPYWIDGVEYATLAGLPGKAMAFASAVVLKTGPTEPQQTRLWCIQPDEDPNSPTFGQLAGNCFYWAVNKARSGHRGMSDLFSLADWLDGYDQMLYSVMNLMDSLSRFVWDVTLTGMTQEEIEQWLKDHGKPPRPNSVRAHNEKVTWAAVNPTLQATDKSEGVRLIKNHALAGAGYPEHWFAEGDRTNRATALAQGEPTLKMLTSRQRYVKSMLTHLLEWVIDCSVRSGALPESIDRAFDASFPELSVGDQQATATALNQAAQALTTFQSIGASDKKTAALFLTQMASQLGIQADPDEIIANAQQEAEARKAQDFTRPELFQSPDRPPDSGKGAETRTVSRFAVKRPVAGAPGSDQSRDRKGAVVPTETEGPPGTIDDGAPDGGSEDGMNTRGPNTGAL